MADGELGNLRRAPRIIEHKISKQSRYRTEGMAGGQFDAVIPVDVTDTISSLADSTSDGGGPVPEWFTESLTLTSGAAATWSLTYIPLDYSEVISLNGIVLVETTDYTITDNVVTWTNLADLILGIGSDSWKLTATYPYYDQAANPDPTVSYAVAVTAWNLFTNPQPITIPHAVVTDEVGVIAIRGTTGGGTPSGAWTTWTKIYDGAPGLDGTNGWDTIEVWLGTGVGSGTTVNISNTGGYGSTDAVLVAYADVSGTVSIRNSAKINYAAGATPSTISATNVTAVVGDLIFSAAVGYRDSTTTCNPDGTDTGTGVAGSLSATFSWTSAGSAGIVAAGGIATATTTGYSFGMTTSPAGDGWSQAINLALQVV